MNNTVVDFPGLEVLCTLLEGKLNAETIWNFRILKFLKRKIAMATIWGNTVGPFYWGDRNMNNTVVDFGFPRPWSAMYFTWDLCFGNTPFWLLSFSIQWGEIFSEFLFWLYNSKSYLLFQKILMKLGNIEQGVKNR